MAQIVNVFRAFGTFQLFFKLQQTVLYDVPFVGQFANFVCLKTAFPIPCILLEMACKFWAP